MLSNKLEWGGSEIDNNEASVMTNKRCKNQGKKTSALRNTQQIKGQEE
jgi:hypothetical protein